MTTQSDKIEEAKTLLKDIEAYFTKQTMGRSDIGSIKHALRTVATNHYKELIDNPTPEVLKKLVQDVYKFDSTHGGVNMLITYLEQLCVVPEPESDSPLKYW